MNLFSKESIEWVNKWLKPRSECQPKSDFCANQIEIWSYLNSLNGNELHEIRIVQIVSRFISMWFGNLFKSHFWKSVSVWPFFFFFSLFM